MFFTEHLLAIEMKKKQGAYLGLSILELSKILTCEFWFDYVKPRYGDDCIIWIKTVSLYT